MNIIFCTGRLGQDARSSQTQSGVPLVSFRLAVDIGWGDKKTTEWRSCSYFGKGAGGVAPYLVKGAAVAIAGEPKIASYTDKEGNEKYYMEINVTKLDLIGTQQGQERSQTQAEKPARPSKPTAADSFNDDMPF